MNNIDTKIDSGTGVFNRDYSREPFGADQGKITGLYGLLLFFFIDEYTNAFDYSDLYHYKNTGRISERSNV
jgi:hypothetical protein